MLSRLLISSIAVIGLSIGIYVPVLAQVTSGAITAPSSDGLQEIIVTASKRPERELDVPAAITAFSGDDLLNSGTNSMRDFAGFTPGLQFNSNLSTGAPVIRGITEGLDTSPTVATIINGAPIGSSSSLNFGAQDALDLDPIDFTRVEVLKGPQGTLYGANTLAGLVSYTLREPDLTTSTGTIRVEGAGTDHGSPSESIRGAFGTPLITDVLAVRGSAYYDKEGGFIDNSTRGISDQDKNESWGLHGSVLYKPADKLQIALDGFYQSVKANAADTALYNFKTHAPLNGDLQYDDYLFPTNSKEDYVGLANVSYDLDWANLTSITSYQRLHSDVSLNGSHSALGETIFGVLPLFGGAAFPPPPLASIDHDVVTHKVTEEVRLTSSGTGPLSWIVGAFYSDEDNAYLADVLGHTTTGGTVATLDPAFALDLRSTLKEYSGFANVTYKFFNVFDITGGIRVGKIDQTYHQGFYGSSADAYNTLLAVVLDAPPIPALTPTASSSANAETYLGTLRYHFSDDGMIFARFSTGYRPGGPNLQAPGLPTTFGPDKTGNVELGVKSRFWDGRGSVDVTAYHTTWHDIQVAIATPSGIPGYTSGGDARVEGVESSLNLRPIPQLTLGATFAYSDGKVTEANPAAAGSLAKDDPLPDDPRFSGSLSAQYQVALNTEWNGYASATERLVGARHSAFASSTAFPDYVLPSYNQLDVHAGAKHGIYTLDLFVKNVTDQRAQLAAQTGQGIAEVTVARPRTIGLALTASY